MKRSPARRRTKKRAQPGLPTFLKFAHELAARAFSFLRSARIQRRVRRMQLIERLTVGNKHSVVLLRVDDQEFVLGCSGESMTLLGVKQPDATTIPQIPTKEDLVRAFRSIQ